MSTTATEEVTLLELITQAIELHAIDLHVSLPARVESFSASSQTVEVTIMVNRMVPDGATPPNWVSEQMPRLKDVPVGFPRGGGMFVSLPLKQGDPGMLVFAERALGVWRSTGAQADPGDLGMHTLDGAYFLPCVAPDKSALANADANNMVIGSDSQPNARIIIKPSGEIDLGSSASDFVAMATKVKNYLVALSAAINGWTPVANDGGAALKTALSSAGIIGGTWGTDVASTNAKAT